MMHKNFTGKVALITGAASGIGKATAMKLAQLGANVFLGDINAELLAQTVREIADATGASVKSRVYSVGDADQCRLAVREAVEAFGRLDILCNIAGFAKAKHLADITDQEWKTMLDVNLSGVFFTSQAAMPHLIESKGCIVNMASSAGVQGQAYNSMYCASKAGVVMLSKSMAIEFAKKGVRVNAVCPGAVSTPLMANFEIPEGVDMDLIAKLFSLLPVATPEEIADAVIYLVSPQARYITGEALSIDGGQTAG